MDYVEGAPAPSSTSREVEAGARVGLQEGLASYSVGDSQAQASACNSLDLFGQLEHFYYNAAQYQSAVYALAATIGFLSGITGRAYNTPTKTGLNQSILVLGDSGSGKDAIASGTAKLYNLIAHICPSITKFRGPGELVSSAGLLRWLEKNPCCYSIVGEIGKLMKIMSAPNASQYLKMLNRTVMQLTSKSGVGETFDPAAYADTDKNIGIIASPSFTLLGESVPSVFYEALDDDMVVDGWAGRFLIFEEKGKRRYRNEAADTFEASKALIGQLADLAAHVLGLMKRGEVQFVQWTAEAEGKFREFDHWTTDQNNGAVTQGTKELWSRVNLKAIRLASVRAVARNYLKPVITLDDTMWATSLVVAQTQTLISKISNGDVGMQAGNQTKQQRLVLWALTDFLQNYEKLEKLYPYERSYEYASQGVIPYAHISQKIGRYAAFRNDRLGQIPALKRTIQELLDIDFIREMPPQQMAATFGGKGRGFVIADPNAIKQVLDRA